MVFPELSALSEVLETFEIKATADAGSIDLDELSRRLTLFPQLSWMVWREGDKWRAAAVPLKLTAPPGIYVQY